MWLGYGQVVDLLVGKQVTSGINSRREGTQEYAFFRITCAQGTGKSV